MDPIESAVAEAFGEEVPETPEPEASTEEGTSEAPQQTRDEQGRFAKAEEPAGETQIAGGRFKSYDELEKAYLELDSEYGRRGQEFGEMRKQLAEIQQSLQPEPGIEIDQGAVDWFDQQFADNPQAGAMWALQNDPTGTLYHRVMDEWYETPGQARAAASFERQFEMRQLYEYIQSQQAPLQQQAFQNELASSWASLSREMPDLDNPEIAERMLKEAEGAPEILAALKSGKQEDTHRVIRNLYKLAMFEQANQIAGSAQADTTQPNADEAFVASGSQRVDPESKSRGEQWAEENLDPYLERYFGTREF